VIAAADKAGCYTPDRSGRCPLLRGQRGRINARAVNEQQTVCKRHSIASPVIIVGLRPLGGAQQ
jgi:hypothetical protein